MTADHLLAKVTADLVAVRAIGDSIELQGPREAVERWADPLAQKRPEVLAHLNAHGGYLAPADERRALKGCAVLMGSAGGFRVWLVEDTEDAEQLGDVGGAPVLTRAEIRELCKLQSPDALASVLAFKGAISGRVRTVSVAKPSRLDIEAALAMVRAKGVTTWTLDGRRSVQIPEENDSPGLRDALRLLGYDRLPVVLIEPAEDLAA